MQGWKIALIVLFILLGPGLLFLLCRCCRCCCGTTYILSFLMKDGLKGSRRKPRSARLARTDIESQLSATDESSGADGDEISLSGITVCAVEGVC